MSWLRGYERFLHRFIARTGPSTNEIEQRSLALLLCNLSPVQRQQYQGYGYFNVIGGDTGKRYRIRPRYQMNVEELDRNGRTIRVLCFMPGGRVPVADIMLAQKFALELFETEAITIAKQGWDFTLEEQESRIARRYPRL